VSVSMRLGKVAYDVWQQSSVNIDDTGTRPCSWDELRKDWPMEAEMWALIADAIVTDGSLYLPPKGCTGNLTHGGGIPCPVHDK
jgi:hypothetical protein